jgi:hypothetical protein
LCAIAQLELGRNAGTVRRGRGACADLLPASSVVDYGAGSQMRRGGTAMVTDAEGSTVKEWHGRRHNGRGVEGVLPERRLAPLLLGVGEK